VAHQLSILHPAIDHQSNNRHLEHGLRSPRYQRLQLRRDQLHDRDEQILQAHQPLNFFPVSVPMSALTRPHLLNFAHNPLPPVVRQQHFRNGLQRVSFQTVVNEDEGQA
jgi:hypothetical protein